MTATTAMAQDAIEPAAGPDRSTVDEIVVTAQRRSERLLDVPIAVTAASGDQLEDAGIVSIEQLSRIAPGVVISRTGAYSQPAIRGVSTQNAGAGADNNVAVYVDGIYRPFQRSLLMDLVNLKSIEVLKGPQGTLFGRNATGGALLISTLDPTPELSGKVAASYGRFNDRSVTGYVSVPLGDDLGLVLTGYRRKSDNYIRDVGGFDPAPIDNRAVTAKLVYHPIDDLKITLGYENRETFDPTGLTYNFVDNSVVSLVVSPSATRSVERNVTSLNRSNQAKNFYVLYSGHVEWNTPLGVVNSYTAYQTDDSNVRFDYDGTNYELSDQRYREAGDAFSQEVNIASSGDQALSYVAGLFYMKSDAAYHDYTISSFSPALGQITTIKANPNSLETEAFAAYVDLTYNLGDKWFFTGGLRYGTEDRRAIVRSGTTGAAIVDRSGTFSSLTPRAVLRYAIDDSSNVYASYSRGYKAGNFNISAPYGPIDPEELSAYELGYKAAFGRIRLNAAAYYYKYEDLQVTSFVIDPQGRATTQTTNAATATVKGAELEVIAEVTNNFELRVSGAYNDAKYDQYRQFSPSLVNASTGLNVASCPTPTNPVAPCISDLSGQTLIRAPEWTFNVNGTYTIPLPKGDLSLVANVSYSSEYAPTRPDFALDPSNVVNGIIQPSNSGYRFGQSAFTLVNLRATWNVDDSWALSAYANNVFDEDYLVSHSGNTTGRFLTHGEPQVYGVRVEYAF